MLSGREVLRRRAVLCGTAALLAAAPASRVVLAATPIARLDLALWRQRHQAVLARVAQGGIDLIFLGDSITQNWERSGPPDYLNIRPVWDRFYGDRHAVNMGFAGDTTASLLWRVQNGEINGIAPRVAVILIGANNMGRVHWSADDTVLGIRAVVAEVQRRLPRTHILLLGVLPSDRSAWVTRTTDEVNAALARQGVWPRSVTFMDVSAVFMADGRVDRGLFYDPLLSPPGAPLHPTALGHARLAAAIEPTLSALMGDRDHR